MAIKTCPKCEQDFDKSTKGKNPYCPPCSRAYRKELQRSIQDRIWEIKSVPCADCGQEFHPVCMDFDHVRGTKLFSIGKAANQAMAWDKIQNEIDKCDVVCSNCHRLRTHCE